MYSTTYFAIGSRVALNPQPNHFSEKMCVWKPTCGTRDSHMYDIDHLLIRCMWLDGSVLYECCKTVHSGACVNDICTGL